MTVHSHSHDILNLLTGSRIVCYYISLPTTNYFVTVPHVINHTKL
jgi:hypothetical protein